MATIYSFDELYTGECEHCGADLEDWDWLEDDMVFRTSCTCGIEYILKPTSGVLTSEPSDFIDEEEDEEE